MAFEPTSAIRDDHAEWWLDLLDVESDAGWAVFEEENLDPVASLELSKPARVGAASSGVVTFDTISPDTYAAGGLIHHLAFKDGGNITKFTVGVATDTSQECQIDTLTIVPGSTVGISTATLTSPESS